jgi:hypothetical protein
MGIKKQGRGFGYFGDTNDKVFNTTRVIGRAAEKTLTCLSFV